MSQSIRILLADDHPVVRDGLAAMLSTQPDFAVIGQAASGADAVRQAQQLQPDVIVLDLEMPELDGVEALRQIQAANPSARVIVFTAFDTDERIVAAIQAGASGYLLKGSPRDELFRAVRVVAEGGSLLHPVVATKLMNAVRARARRGDDSEALTEREREVLQLVAQGTSNKAIARILHITERTVKFHVSAILGKLGAGNRTEAARMAVKRGLVSG